MPNYADLEITVGRTLEDNYITRMRLHMPHSAADVDLLEIDPVRIVIDEQQLLLAVTDLDYGKELGSVLFADPTVREAFASARTVAARGADALRIRLNIAPTAQALHALHWEKLVLPGTEEHLFDQARFPFSRFIQSGDLRDAHLRRYEDLRALFVAANPTDLAQKYKLQPINVHEEFAAIRSYLEGVPVQGLGINQRATLSAIEDALKDRYDILYLLCHGSVGDSGPALLLENDDGSSERVHAEELNNILRNLEHPPRLIILASCQSAGTGHPVAVSNRDVLTSVGPTLASGGIPAVIAMQGDVQVDAVQKFVRKFFQELRADGLIDRAVAEARKELRRGGHVDWWKPILFMRLLTGTIRWYKPGFSSHDDTEQTWNDLLTSIEEKECTPVLGTGLQELIVGSRRALARRWAQEHVFPIAPNDVEDFAHISYYIAVQKGMRTLSIEFGREIKAQVRQRFGEFLGGLPESASSNQHLLRAGEYLRRKSAQDPHRVIAELRAPIIFTADQTDLLKEALVDIGLKPRMEYCRWRNDLARRPLLRDTEPDYVPSPEEPLIFHLFGHIDILESLVLTEDSYFEYLQGVQKHLDLMPELLFALTTKNLMMIGFNLEDWSFRTFARVMMNLEGKDRIFDNTNVAAQVDLGAERVTDHEAAREFLKKAFRGVNLRIFTGEISDFVGELQRRRQLRVNPHASRTDHNGR
jgi:hypothetical protein